VIPPFPSPPALEELRGLRVHEAVRDYPELLPHLTPTGNAMEEGGVRLVSQVAPEVPGGEGELLLLLAWRAGRGG
jgi:hypothetical protein